MTHENNQSFDDLNWMNIAREDAINDVRHSGQRLPFIAAAVSLLIIAGGAVFAQTSNEAPAQAEEISTSQSPVAAPSTDAPAISPNGIPDIPNVTSQVNGYYEDDYEGKDEDYEDGDDRGDPHGDDD